MFLYVDVEVYEVPLSGASSHPQLLTLITHCQRMLGAHYK